MGNRFLRSALENNENHQFSQHFKGQKCKMTIRLKTGPRSRINNFFVLQYFSEILSQFYSSQMWVFTKNGRGENHQFSQHFKGQKCKMTIRLKTGPRSPINNFFVLQYFSEILSQFYSS